MSLVITAGRRPRAISTGTIASISAVLPEPTGPPTPTRWTSSVGMRFLLIGFVRSTGEQLCLGPFVPGRHHVDERGAAADVLQGAEHRGIRRLLDHRGDAADQRLGAA